LGGEPNEYAAAIDAMRDHGAEALVIVPLPELHRDSEVLGLGELGQQAASYVERTFKSAPAGEFPFQGPTRFDFTISMKTAETLGVTIPTSVLVSPEVID
jgi:putative tryptophan/tyrosine transport system substrate-binding protein